MSNKALKLSLQALVTIKARIALHKTDELPLIESAINQCQLALAKKVKPKRITPNG